MMVFRKIILIVLLVCLLSFLPLSRVFADENFQTDVNVEYKILDEGLTTVTNTISVKNLKSDYFPKQYVLNLSNVKPKNVKAYESGYLLKTTLKDTENGYSILINFNNLTVGKGNVKTFVVSFEDETLTQKTGEIWEILLPKVNDPENYNSYKVSLSIPSSIGELAYISPEPTIVKNIEDRQIYVYEAYDELESGASAGFGVFQVFSFELKYHLPESSTGIQEIALPPDTSTQKMFYESVSPLPKEVYQDIDGNWIASFKVSDNNQKEIIVKGKVQIFSKATNISHIDFETKPHDLLPTVYWQSDDPEIKSIANNLRDVKEIYDYVVGTLDYNYERVSKDYVRYGAIEAVKNPQNALCLEFTDLFIALARAKGIPAREINGFAYSQNSSIEPLSLVSDILHSWPEYWDEEKRIWVPIDPTWGDTTGGVDFFNNFDLRHFAFVIHSENSVQPFAAGMYKSSMDPRKDVKVEFSNLPERQSLNVKIETKSSFVIPFFKSRVKVHIRNNGLNAVYTLPIRTEYGEKKYSENLNALLPFSEKTVDLDVDYGLFSINSPDVIMLSVGNLIHSIPLERSHIIVGQLVLISFVILMIVLYIYWRSHRTFFSDLVNNVKKIFTPKSF